MKHKTETQIATCEGKHRYASYAAVERVIRYLRRRHKPTRIVYRCRYCSGWHTTRP